MRQTATPGAALPTVPALVVIPAVERPAADLLIAYADRLAAAPGDRVAVFVSSPAPIAWDVVRLHHGDTAPAGPGLRETPVPASGAGRAEGRLQRLPHGSCAVATAGGDARLPEAFTLACWVLPTGPGVADGALLARGAGVRLVLRADGRLALRTRDAHGAEAEAATSQPARSRTWYAVVARVDVAAGTAAVDAWPRPGATSPAAELHGTGPVVEPAVAGCPWSLGATVDAAGARAEHLDGRLARPTVLTGVPDARSVARRLHDHGAVGGSDVLASWELGGDPAADRLPDVSGHGADLRLVNCPARAVTSFDWTGEHLDWRAAPEQYAALHVHRDDLEDAGWEADLEVTLDPGLASGVYAVRLRAGDGQVDRVPIVVRPSRPRSRIAVLLPTFTYLAYGGERIAPEFDVVAATERDAYVTASGLLSQYNRHSDGSGVMYASRLRPLPELRPDHRYWLTGHPHGLGADLHLLDWLEHEGVEVDVLDDEGLHERGAGALEPYGLLITGSHPEYVTSRELLAFEAFLQGGGNMMYLGGNGFTMVTGVLPDRPHVTEIRRAASHAGLWESEPGEGHLASTGERGGRWSDHRLRPRGLFGVETVAMGFHGGAAYRRTAAAADPRAAFVFEGVSGEDIGGYGLVLGAAASYETDGADLLAGTPPHALVLATARDLGPEYVALGPDPDLRADMVLFETPAGGTVFSVGSIGWCGALSHQDYENDVARITGNVLRRLGDR